MKKKIVVSACCLMVAIVGSVSLFSSGKLADNDLLMANVEALSQDEIGPRCSASSTCKIADDIRGSVSCQGKDHCESGYGYVICDGLKSVCTNQVEPDQRKNS